MRITVLNYPLIVAWLFSRLQRSGLTMVLLSKSTRHLLQASRLDNHLPYIVVIQAHSEQFALCEIFASSESYGSSSG